MKNKNMVYTPFNSDIAEKIEVIDRKLIYDDKENVDTIIFKLRKELDDGEIKEFYKATKFFRLVRVSRETERNTKLMEIHSDILRGLYAARVNFVQIIANILEPTPLGLIMLYGAQGTGETESEAIDTVEGDYTALKLSFQGTHRTTHIQKPKHEEMKWIFFKMRKQKYVSFVKGIPSMRKGSGSNKGSFKNDISTEEQLEQFISGMSTEEFLMLLMATPINQSVLRTWLTKGLKEQTKWEGQKQGTNSLSMGIAVPMAINAGSGMSEGASENIGHSQGESASQSWGESHSEGVSMGQSEGHSIGESWNEGGSEGSSVNMGQNESRSEGSNWGENTNKSWNAGGSAGVSMGLTGNASYGRGGGSGASHGGSESVSQGSSMGQGFNESKSWGVGGSEGHSTSKSYGTSVNQGSSVGGSQGKSVGVSRGQGSSKGVSMSRGGSLGLAPNVGISKSYQFQDITVAYICELLEIQNQRLKDSTEGEGAFFVDMYISTDDKATQKAIEGMAQTTWVNSDSKIDVLRAVTPPREDQQKLAMHIEALSPCLDTFRNRVGKGYKYTSILQSSELTSYSHPPRITAGGIENSTDDRPLMRVPTNRQNFEIMAGNVINGERFNTKMAEKHFGNGYMTDFKYSISKDELHHAFIAGQSGSGKTVGATRLVSELYNNCFDYNNNGTKRRKRLLILDPKGDWRRLGHIIPKGKFRFYTLHDPLFHPLRMNVLRVPKNVKAYDYFNMVTEHFTSAYGLMDRAVAQIKQVIYDLYNSVGAFDNIDDHEYANERTKNITMEDVYDSIAELRDEAQKKNERYNVDALNTYLTRLDMYKKEFSTEYIMFCNRDGMSIENILGDDSVTVIESRGLAEAAQSFFFTLLMDGIFKYAQGVKGFYRKPDQYETFLVLEEANVVLNPGGDERGTLSMKRFEELLDQSRSFGLFAWVITQKISLMPDSVVANSGIIATGMNKREMDVKIIMKALGKDARFDDRQLEKFIPKMPVGEFIMKLSKSHSEIETEPVLIKFLPLDLPETSDDQLDLIIKKNKISK